MASSTLSDSFRIAGADIWSGSLPLQCGRRAGSMVGARAETIQGASNILDLISSDAVGLIPRDCITSFPKAGQGGAGRVRKPVSGGDQLVDCRAMVPPQQLDDRRCHAN